jgi:hypothetical protein
MISRRYVFKLTLWAVMLLLGAWVLTLGIFVETSLDFGYQDEEAIHGDIRVAAAPTRSGTRETGIPYLFFKRTDTGPFGVSLRVLSPRPLDKLQITKISIDGQQIDVESIELTPYENRNFFFTIPGVVQSKDRVDVDLAGTVVVDGEHLDFETSHFVSFNFETRFGPGWMMLFYYSEF